MVHECFIFRRNCSKWLACAESSEVSQKVLLLCGRDLSQGCHLSHKPLFHFGTFKGKNFPRQVTNATFRVECRGTKSQTGGCYTQASNYGLFLDSKMRILAAVDCSALFLLPLSVACPSERRGEVWQVSYISFFKMHLCMRSASPFGPVFWCQGLLKFYLDSYPSRTASFDAPFCGKNGAPCVRNCPVVQDICLELEWMTVIWWTWHGLGGGITDTPSIL